MGNPRPGRGRHQRMGQLVQHRPGHAAHPGPPARRIRAGLARRHTRPGPRPRPGQQAPPATRRRRRWPPLITQAGSARTRRGSAPDPGPPQRCPGRSRRVRRQAGISSPAVPPGDGTPAQVKGASGVAGDDAEASPLTSPGNPRRNAGCPTRRCPPPGAAWQAQPPATRRGSWTAQLDRCSIKQKRKLAPPPPRIFINRSRLWAWSSRVSAPITRVDWRVPGLVPDRWGLPGPPGLVALAGWVRLPGCGHAGAGSWAMAALSAPLP